jgi:ATP-dependent DNA helicase RecG
MIFNQMNLSLPLSEALNTKKEYILALKEIGLFTVRDLLLYFPRTYEDLSEYKSIKGARDGDTVTTKGFLHGIKQIPTKNRKIKLIKALFFDDSGFECEVVWFNQPHLIRMLPMDTPVIVSGKVQYSYGKYTLQSPAVERANKPQVHTGGTIPVYPQHDVITSKWLRTKIHPLLHLASEFEEVLPEELLKEEGLISKGEAIKEIHFPSSQKKLEAARDRLGYEELFLLQLRSLKNKRDWQQSRSEDSLIQGMGLDPEFVKSFFSTLPFMPTNGQKVAIYEILKDMERPFPMMRLLEGDVGSGKTLVAMTALLQAVKNGYQTAVMAPTEVLARQHLSSIIKFVEAYEAAGLSLSGIRVELLVGSLKTKEKQVVTEAINNGQVDIAVGTHALIQQGVNFQKLGLVVIDEQHRFGVKQREVLVMQGSPHVLNMTATPIPRTLALVAYGDQDLSVITEMPPGRMPIETKIVPPEHRKSVYEFVDGKMEKGEQVYVICPLIEESDKSELKSVKQEFENLQAIYPHRKVAYLHGKMKGEEKDQIMSDFKANKYHILVSTSVIEVGIDVPNATIMLIEGADRFGLSQLHQFRGRVGRGQVQSYCFLFTESTSQQTFTRLKAMADYSDGFQLAEIDMKLRGPGEVYGVRQSGLPDLKVANLMNGVLLDRVRKAAEVILEKSPNLSEYPRLKSSLDELKRKMEADK